MISETTVMAIPEEVDLDNIKPRKEWSISNPPPAGHKDVGEFFFNLYEDSRKEKEKLLKPEQWFKNYNYFKGNHWDRESDTSTKVSVNLFFANVIRTVANIVNRDPIAEVENLDGSDGGSAMRFTRKMEKWWKETNQHQKLRTSDINNEVYGITIEKPFWDAQLTAPNTAIVDPYAFFPCPGYWEDLPLDCPYIAHAVPEPVSALKKKYCRNDIEQENYYYDLGRDRDEHQPVQVKGELVRGTYRQGGRQYYGAVPGEDVRSETALKIEIWIRVDESLDYPGGIRCVTLTNEGNIVLNDCKNPNINWNLEPEKYQTNFLFKRLPFFVANSYEDSSSIWGFSALDQTYELAIKVEELVSMAIAYHMRSAYGILVVSKRSGIKRSQLSNKPGLVLFPDSDVDQVKFVPLPSLPSSYFSLIDLIVSLHDRIYAVEDADRGESPNGVVAASAIVALQEKNAVLIQHKIDAIEKLVANRGNSAIALWQMHGHVIETISSKGETFQFKGTDFAGMQFNYIVQAGSTMTKTREQKQQQSAELYKEGAIDTEALLTDLNYPQAKAVLERQAEGQLQQALGILVQAGLPEEMALQLNELLAEAQHRKDITGQNQAPVEPGDNTPMSGQAGENIPTPGTPRSQQGTVQ